MFGGLVLCMPLMDLLLDKDLLMVLLPAMVGSGALSALIAAWAGRRQSRAATEQMAVQAAHEATEIMREDIIEPLRTQVDDQDKQIKRLEERQAQYWVAVSYIRSLCHWLDPAVKAMEPEYMARHPKPRLPDELRAQVAPDTLARDPPDH
ncbi:hypothetical protein [Bifidobacterium bombi]|uniref:PRTRC system protein E n=1 Tax=Bifidobacterium bombi DSM 19703 TaxID=1341695 RepID=A0A080N4R3_9BIFI|nr:hypothetical protein [Bifidobacterium bombi]KFF31640.1 hypothetical protein BBOMB_1026 [Bifidobacterium bombi DSM 19703]